MASLLDVTLLENFSKIFIWILIFVVVYAVLIMSKILGDNKSLMSLVALSVATMFMFSEKAIDMISFMIPWFVLMGMFILFILFNYRILGGEGGVMDILGARHKTVVYWIIIGGIIIVLMALANNYGQSVGPYLDEEGNTVYRNSSSPVEGVSGIGDNFRGTGDVNSGDFQTNLGATLFHPKVLGMVLILAIAAFTILFMVKA